MPDQSAVDVNQFASMLRTKRAGRPLREIAAEIGGVTASTLSRVERGNVPDLDTFMRVCRWLGVSPDQFSSKKSTAEAITVPEMIEANLRADRVLPADAINALSQMVRIAYLAAKEGKLGGRGGE